MKCVILASGFATRLYPLTLTRAKPLLPYKDRPLLSHIIDSLPENVEIFITVNKKFENEFRDWQKELPRKVELIVEDVWTEDQSLGAIGSLNNAIREKSIDDDIMVLAGDNYFEFSMDDFCESCNGDNALIAVCDIGNREEARQLGVISVDGRKVTEFEEKPAEPKSSLVATGCYILPTRVLSYLQEYCASGRRDNLGEFIRYLVDKDEVHSWAFTDTWLDIGTEYSARKDNQEL